MNLWVASGLLVRQWECPWCPRRQNGSRFVSRSQWELVKGGDLLLSTAKVGSALSPVPKTLSLSPTAGTLLKSCVFWRGIMVRRLNNGYNDWGGEIRLCIFSSLFWVNFCKQCLQGSSLIPFNMDVTFPQHISWTVLSLPHWIICHSCQKSLTTYVKACFWVLNAIPLSDNAVFMPVANYFGYCICAMFWNWEVCILSTWFFFLNITWLFGGLLGVKYFRIGFLI